MFLRVAVFALLFGVTSRVCAQEAFGDTLPTSLVRAGQATPESAWLDLRQNAPQNSKTQNAPEWVEAVTLLPAQSTGDMTSKSVFRIRVAQPSANYQVLLFRLFFDDKPGEQPELVAWDESGTHVLHSGALGSGINLPSSDSVIIPITGALSIDIEVAGDGKTVRAAYLDWMTSSNVVHPRNADHRDVIPEPLFLYRRCIRPPRRRAPGTVTALAAEPIRIGASVQKGLFSLALDQPLAALLSFEIANPQVDAAPEIYLNGENIGQASLALPDLADPGYRGEMQSLARQMHFQYTGWLRAQKIVPTTNLKVGTNDLVIVNRTGTGPSAIRATHIQLKYLWDKSDYLLQTGH
jgi:hypothetical protein